MTRSGSHYIMYFILLISSRRRASNTVETLAKNYLIINIGIKYTGTTKEVNGLLEDSVVCFVEFFLVLLHSPVPQVVGKVKEREQDPILFSRPLPRHAEIDIMALLQFKAWSKAID